MLISGRCASFLVFPCEIRDGLYFKLSDWFCNQLENSFDSEFCIE